MKSIGLIALMSLLAVGCSTTDVAWYPDNADVPLFTEMGDHHRGVTTDSDIAQQYFDQGLTWAYAFNHDEAIRSFEQAAAFDPQLRHGVVGRRPLSWSAHQ